MFKKELRKIFLEKRSILSLKEYAELNELLFQNFFLSLDLRKIRILHCFIPIEKKKEINSWLIINRLQQEYPHISIVVPRVNEFTASLDNYIFKDISQLKQNNWGILEPQQGETVSPDKLDIVLVPLLAFDKRGNRVGYGKGFYDKLLSQCRTNCQKVGLSLFEPVDEISDVNEFDFPLTSAITTKGHYVF